VEEEAKSTEVAEVREERVNVEAAHLPITILSTRALEIEAEVSLKTKVNSTKTQPLCKKNQPRTSQLPTRSSMHSLVGAVTLACSTMLLKYRLRRLP
jgi:hypothetical protein